MKVKVASEIAGQVWKSVARVGDDLAADDVIIILESMKMEITVESTTDGLVHSMLKAEGELVKTGEFLLLLDTKKEK